MILALVGLVMVFSASAIVAGNRFQDPGFFLKRQIVWLAFGLVLMQLASRIDYTLWKKLSIPMLACMLLLLALVLVPSFGVSAKGARRWFRIGPLSVQPAVMVKLVAVIFMAAYLTRKGDKITQFRDGLLPALIVIGLLGGLVLLEPDERFEFWSQWLAQQAPRLCPHQREQMTDFAWKLVQLLPFLDRKPFGLELSTRLAASLQRHPDGMFYWHPYYCGHGLRMKAGDYLLAEKDDLEYPPLATWSEEQSFIEAVASWSDYVCSGADPNASLFQATSEFYLDNQRITRARIEEFIENFPAE